MSLNLESTFTCQTSYLKPLVKKKEVKEIMPKGTPRILMLLGKQ